MQLDQECPPTSMACMCAPVQPAASCREAAVLSLAQHATAGARCPAAPRQQPHLQGREGQPGDDARGSPLLISGQRHLGGVVLGKSVGCVPRLAVD